MQIRPLDPACDFPALAALFATRDPEPPTPNCFKNGKLTRQRDWYASGSLPSMTRVRWSATAMPRTGHGMRRSHSRWRRW